MEHVQKRETALGRRFPALLYTLNLLLWVATAVAAGAWEFLWLAILPLPALILYWWRTGRRASDS